MSLLQMSVSGGMLIFAIMLIRAAAVRRLPKRTFSLLWKIALVRLLLPATISSAFCIYPLLLREDLFPALLEKESASSLADHSSDTLAAGSTFSGTENQNSQKDDDSIGNHPSSGRQHPVKATDDSAFPGQIPIPFLFIWCSGSIIMTTFFLLSYRHFLEEFRSSLPVQNEFTLRWIKNHPLRRRISLRFSDRICVPLTYGVFCPVILMPKKVDWENTEQLSCILLHEHIHIRRFDAAFKLLAAVALCIHWFNPMVWLLYVFFNRDTELACDEQAILSPDHISKSIYARTLISMEAQKSGLSPFCSFNENPLEERITSIMKTKKASRLAIFVCTGIVMVLTMAFATQTAPETADIRKNETGDFSAQKGLHEKEEFSEEFPDLPGFSDEDWAKLSALRFDNYETMSITEFKKCAVEFSGATDYQELLKRFSQNETFRLLKDRNAISAFYFYIWEPLTSDHWQMQSSTGFSSAKSGSEAVTLNYDVYFTISDADILTVGQYNTARTNVIGILQSLPPILQEKKWQTLSSEKEFIQNYLEEEFINYQADGLSISAEYSLSSGRGQFSGVVVIEDAKITKELNEQSRLQCERDFAPFEPFGLTWQYTPDMHGGELKMFFEGKEVRSIYDPQSGTWFAAHTGDSSYAADAVDLYTIYENGKLAGLKVAEEENPVP